MWLLVIFSSECEPSTTEASRTMAHEEEKKLPFAGSHAEGTTDKAMIES